MSSRSPLQLFTWLGLIGDPQAYESSRQVLRLKGLSLVESSSGTHRGPQRISKRGRPLLRKQAFMLALRAVRRDGMLRDRFGAMLERNGGKRKKAIVSLSRYMLRLMFAVAREQRRFTPEAPPSRTEVAGSE